MASVQQDYDLGQDFESVVVRCMLMTDGFLSRYRPVMDPDAFTLPDLRFVVSEVLAYYDKYSKSPSKETVLDLIRNSAYRRRSDAMAFVSECDPVSDADYVKDRLINWSKWTAIRSVETSGMVPDPKEYADRILMASRTGDGVISGHTRLSDSIINDGLRGAMVPTPWPSINEKLGGDRCFGGPELGDLCMFLSFINVGKTYALVNVAKAALDHGLLTVYVTFEDGELKIKRRVIQNIANMTKEQILCNPGEAERLRDDFLERTGGSLHIKQAFTKRTTVSDIGAFVRSVEDEEQRPCAAVIVDYMDRLRATRVRSEDRHEMREIAEMCKALSVEQKTVMWSATQAQRGVAGKETVRLENVGEALGKVEGCDLALGLGQTEQDYALGRMTMFEAKVRDSSKWGSINLLSYVETQRLVEAS